ncbi:replication factor A protein 1-like [Ipomoea triloba]|uniref:replication factor A protein 1-like n=1 Tax=Ipomoea triloba TaxID=35885 RepID=UPI00125D37C3|nr:replication factor A protein 1-like [Ipomoea triloba]
MRLTDNGQLVLQNFKNDWANAHQKIVSESDSSSSSSCDVVLKRQMKDVFGTYIHANISKEEVEKYSKVFEEGKVYSIKNFLVVTNYYKYKTTTHKYLIKFNYKTVVKESKSRQFPTHMLRIKSFESLRNPVEVNETELFDVIGRVVEIYSPVQKLIAGKAATLIDFVIADTQNIHLKCTVWDEHVAAIHQFYNIDVEQPIIVAIQLCRAKIVNGEVRITSSYDATNCGLITVLLSLLNLGPSILATENSPHRSITTTTVLSESTGLGDLQSGSITITTLSDLVMKEEDGDYYVPAQIVGIQGSRKGDWYYTSCMSQGCNKKLSVRDNGLLICGKCNKKWEEGCVRYKVVVRVVDKRDDALFLLWDRECADLVGVLASLLFEKYLKVDIDIPPELESLIGMLNDTQEKDLISRMIEEDDDDISGIEGSKGDEVNSSVNATQEKGKETDSENSDTIKRCLMDQFSTSTKLKKSGMVTVKTEKI